MKRILLALAVVAGSSGPALATSITSAQITAATVNPLMLPCLDHCIIGICIWVETTPPFSVRTTLRVRHKFPDIVVSTFEHPGNNPWVEVKPMSAVAAAASQAYGSLSLTPVLGGRHTPAANQMQPGGSMDVRREQIRFNEAEIYGHPLGSLIGQNPIGFGVAVPGLCPVNTTSLFPYFQSGVDVMSWRNPEVELLYPGTWLPFYREVRNSTFTSIWGSVFPRNGLLAGQSDPKKASGVFAQRAADITTNSAQQHIYVRARGASADERSDDWQELAPNLQMSCGAFGGAGGFIANPSIGSATTRQDDFVYQLWRPYECCLPRPGAILVQQIQTPAVCLTLP